MVTFVGTLEEILKFFLWLLWYFLHPSGQTAIIDAAGARFKAFDFINDLVYSAFVYHVSPLTTHI